MLKSIGAEKHSATMEAHPAGLYVVMRGQYSLIPWSNVNQLRMEAPKAEAKSEPPRAEAKK